ncbi:MAG: VWA domain-containing protein [Clostridia bacterium]|nr:VWA domain-containing protein [Clostridia bacterium]
MKKLQKILAIILVVVISISSLAVTAFAAPQNKRYSVLVLDVSGSMWGEPLQELKEAAKKFCEDVLGSSRSKNQIAIVTFESYVTVESEFTNDLDALTEKIDNLDDGGSTYLGEGLAKAKELLDAVDGNVIKNMVVMCDGVPHDTSYAYSVVEACPLEWNIYSLYFAQDGYSSSAAQVMQTIGRTEYVQVEDGSNVLFDTFENTAADVNTYDTNLLVLYIACPVDVSVTLYGVTLDKYNTETAFGKMEFEDEGNNGTKKIVTLSYNPDYEIEITGYDEGTMDYSVEYFCNDKSLYSVSYPTVEVSDETVISTTVDVHDSSIALNVDGDNDGTIDEEIYPNTSASSIWYKITTWFKNLFYAIFGIFG